MRLLASNYRVMASTKQEDSLEVGGLKESQSLSGAPFYRYTYETCLCSAGFAPTASPLGREGLCGPSRYPQDIY